MKPILTPGIIPSTIIRSTIQLPDQEVGWHAGDKMTENGGNMTGIGIELCVNEGNDFDKTMENAAALCAELMKAMTCGSRTLSKRS